MFVKNTKEILTIYDNKKHSLVETETFGIDIMYTSHIMNEIHVTLLDIYMHIPCILHIYIRNNIYIYIVQQHK